MGNDHNSKVITFPKCCNVFNALKVALVGIANFLLLLFHLNHSYRSFGDYAYSCNTSKYFPSPLYHLQQITFTLNHCLPPTILTYNLRATTCWCFPSLVLFHQVLVVTFLWQPITCHSKSYQVAGLLFLYLKGNVNL